MFTTLIASAPASTAMRAASPMSVSVGDELHDQRAIASPRARPQRPRASAHGSAPNPMPPAFVFGQLTFSSNAVNRRVARRAARSRAGTRRCWKPMTFTIVRALGSARAEPGGAARGPRDTRIRQPHGVDHPAVELRHPRRRRPCLGSRLTAFVTNPPSRSRRMTPVELLAVAGGAGGEKNRILKSIRRRTSTRERPRVAACRLAHCPAAFVRRW